MKRSVLVWSCCASLLMSACGPEDVPNKPDPGEDTTPKPPATLTVTGKVVGAPSGSAVSILIPGDGRQPVNVDASGAFSISGVTSPYQLILAEKAKNAAVVYQGLTITSLTLNLQEGSSSDFDPDRSASVEGSLTGGQPSAFSRVAFVSPGSEKSALTGSGNYSLDVSWEGTNALTGTLYALQFEFEDGNFSAPPARYLGFGQRDNVSLPAGAKLSAQDIALSPVTNATLSGSITLPEGYASPVLSVSMAPKAETELNLFGYVLPSDKTTFSFAVPQVAQCTYSMSVLTQEKTEREDAETVFLFKRGVGAGALGAPLVIPAAARLDKPANAAKDVTRSSTFSWSAFANGVHGLSISQDEGSPQGPYTVTIYTREAQATLPDLTPFGITLPANANFSWSVTGIAPAASVDAFLGLSAQGNFFESRVFNDLTIGISRRQAFTTSATP